MSFARTTILTALATIAFASNSLLCRIALQDTDIDAASFTLIRLLSGAVALWLIVRLRKNHQEPIKPAGSWVAALALFAYAACFSSAYLSLPTGTGALLLFGTVQITMIGYGLWVGERLRWVQTIGLTLSLAGLIGLLLPGLTTPPLTDSLLMVGSGLAWGIYSLLGKGVANPIQATAINFGRAVPFALGLSILIHTQLSLDLAGVVYGVASGAIASGMGYAIWYHALPGLKATQAATVQLSVPVLAAIAAIPLLQEAMTLRLGLAAIAVLGGITLVIVAGEGNQQPANQTATCIAKADCAKKRHSRQRLVWSLWLITWLGLLAGLLARQWYDVVVCFSVIHALLFIYLERFNLLAFPVQIRLVYVVWVAIGTYVPYMSWLMGFTTIGLAANLFVGYCPLARMLSLLPINRSEPFSIGLVKRTFFSPPVQGRFTPPTNVKA